MKSHKEELDAINIGGLTVAYNQDRTSPSPAHRFNTSYHDAVKKSKTELTDKVNRLRIKASSKPVDSKGKITFRELMNRLNKQFNPRKLATKDAPKTWLEWLPPIKYAGGKQVWVFLLAECLSGWWGMVPARCVEVSFPPHPRKTIQSLKSGTNSWKLVVACDIRHRKSGHGKLFR